MITVGVLTVIGTMVLSFTINKPSFSSSEKPPTKVQVTMLSEKSLSKPRKLLSVPVNLSAKIDGNGFDEREIKTKKKTSSGSDKRISWTTALLWLIFIAGAIDVIFLKKDSALSNKLGEQANRFSQDSQRSSVDRTSATDSTSTNSTPNISSTLNNNSSTSENVSTATVNEVVGDSNSSEEGGVTNEEL